MLLLSWLDFLGAGCKRASSGRHPAPRRAVQQQSFRPTLEHLEDRTVPSNFTAASVSDLIAAINAANQTAESDTITLVAGKTFTLTAVNNTTHGATGLPTIAATENLTIVGNGDVIQRSTGAGTPAFRLLDVAAGGSLTMADLTLQGGLAFGSGVSAEGGAIFNQGTLNLNNVTVQQNVAQSMVDFVGQSAGGGISSNGALTLQSCTIQNNQALGGNGINSSGGGGDGGHAFGGGIAIASGTANLTNVTVVSNTAKGGNGGKGLNGKLSSYAPDGVGGNGLGGGIYVGSGSVLLVGTAMNQNTATGGNGLISGVGQGGGMYIKAGALVALDAFTLANVKHNHASTSDPDIYGSFSLI